MLSPATPSSRSFRNISTPVTTFLVVGLNPTISISSPTFTFPRSTRPVTTVPRPENREDVFNRHQKRLVHFALRQRHIRVQRFHGFRMESTPAGSPFNAPSALTRTTGTASPGNL